MENEVIRITRQVCCRLCLAPDSECVSIYGVVAADREPLAQKIQSCVSIKVNIITSIVAYQRASPRVRCRVTQSPSICEPCRLYRENPFYPSIPPSILSIHAGGESFPVGRHSAWPRPGTRPPRPPAMRQCPDGAGPRRPRAAILCASIFPHPPRPPRSTPIHTCMHELY